MRQKSGKADAPKGKNTIYLIILFVIIASVILVMVLPSLNEEKAPQETGQQKTESPKAAIKKEGEVIFADAAGVSKIKIDVEIADTDYDRTLGLMYREGMKDTEGMLFVFPYEDKLSFWMKNTIMSLDMIFINSKREIVTIHRNTTPYSEQSYPSTGPSQYVVEVIAGFCERHNVNTGDKVFWQ